MPQSKKASNNGRWSERIEKLPSLPELEARMLSNCTAVRIAREQLIEELGAHMCGGGGGGPAPKEIRAFKHMGRIGEKIRRDMADHLHVPLMKRLVRLDKKDSF